VENASHEWLESKRVFCQRLYYQKVHRRVNKRTTSHLSSIKVRQTFRVHNSYFSLWKLSIILQVLRVLFGPQ